MPEPAAAQGWVRRRAEVSIARALGASTRADIYSHLQARGEGLTVRDVAATFELHPNVARTHLETLADAGLVVVGSRKHPGGGRPAKLYLAREDVAVAGPATGQSDARLLIRLLARLADGPQGHERAFELAATEGRRLAAPAALRTKAGRTQGTATRERAASPTDPMVTAVEAGLRALRAHVAGLQLVGTERGEWVDVSAAQGVFVLLADERPELGAALERGLLTGAVAAAGHPVAVAAAGTLPDGRPTWRLRPAARGSVRDRLGSEPVVTVDARGTQRERGVVQAMRAATSLEPGDVLEVLAEGPGSPAAFARWIDRAGHQLLGVERAGQPDGRAAIRLLIRKGG